MYVCFYNLLLLSYRNTYYSGDWASFNLQGIEKWADEEMVGLRFYNNNRVLYSNTGGGLVGRRFGWGGEEESSAPDKKGYNG